MKPPAKSSKDGVFWWRNINKDKNYFPENFPLKLLTSQLTFLPTYFVLVCLLSMRTILIQNQSMLYYLPRMRPRTLMSNYFLNTCNMIVEKWKNIFTFFYEISDKIDFKIIFATLPSYHFASISKVDYPCYLLHSFSIVSTFTIYVCFLVKHVTSSCLHIFIEYNLLTKDKARINVWKGIRRKKHKG